MSDGERQNVVSENEDDQYEYEEEEQKPEQKQVPRTMQRARQNQQMQPRPHQQQMVNGGQVQNNEMAERVTGALGGNGGAIRQSRIKDRPVPKESRDSSLKIKIELDLEVEVDLYARVKGDVTIGLM